MPRGWFVKAVTKNRKENIRTKCSYFWEDFYFKCYEGEGNHARLIQKISKWIERRITSKRIGLRVTF